MTELQTALNGGVQIVPEWTEQVVFLDFGGAQTSYNGEILTLDDVNVENSGLTASRIAEITVRLNAEYAKRGIRFVTTEPISGEYSTIYIGKTSALFPANIPQSISGKLPPLIPTVHSTVLRKRLTAAIKTVPIRLL